MNRIPFLKKTEHKIFEICFVLFLVLRKFFWNSPLSRLLWIVWCYCRLSCWKRTLNWQLFGNCLWFIYTELVLGTNSRNLLTFVTTFRNGGFRGVVRYLTHHSLRQETRRRPLTYCNEESSMKWLTQHDKCTPERKSYNFSSMKPKKEGKDTIDNCLGMYIVRMRERW